MNGFDPNNWLEREPGEVEPQRPLIALRSATSAQAILSNAWTVKGLVPRYGLGVTYGAPGSGKSFFETTLAVHVALGIDFFGHKVRQGKVVYLFLEGGRMAENRLVALKEKYGDIDDLYFASCDINLGDEHTAAESDVKLLIETINTLVDGAVMIVIDTLSRSLAGHDENSSVDMTRFIRNVTMIAEQTSAHVRIVHHSGKDAAKGSRGHSSLLGAVDVEAEISRPDPDQPHRLFRITKMKDGDDSAEIGFKLNSVELGIDDDGDRVTTAIVEAISEDELKKTQEEKKAPLGGNEKLVMEAFTIFSDDHHRMTPSGTGWPGVPLPCVVEEDFATFCKGRMTGEQKYINRNYKRALENLIQKRRVLVLNDGLLWSIK